MSRSFFRRENEIERLLHRARPRASEELTSRLAAEAASPAPTRTSLGLRGRFVLAGSLTALMAGALAATGGIGYAASTVSHVVADVTHHSTVMGARLAVSVKKTSAAADQYTTATGTSSSSTVGGGTSQIKPTTVSAGSSTTVNLGSTSTTQNGVTTTTALTAKVTSSTVTLTVNSTSSAAPGTTTSLTTVSLSASTYQDLTTSSGVASVIVDPKPTVTTLGGQPVVGTTVEFKDSNGNPVHVSNLATPISVSIAAPAGGFPASYVPAFSTDGTTFTAIPKLADGVTTLGPDEQTGYYVDASGNIVILSRHTTIFAAIARTGLGVSETGRKLKAAGSGLFGDALLVHPGPAVLKQVGAKVSVVTPTLESGHSINFSFFADEQVAAYIAVFDGNKKLPIALHGSMVRGSTSKKNVDVKAWHIPVLRPGTLPIQLRIPDGHLAAGHHYRIRVMLIDYDGNKTFGFIPFTG